MDKLNIVDMFCGGGGESTGLIEAADKMFFYNAWRHRYRGLTLGEPEAKSYEKAKENLKKAVIEIKEHKKRRWK